MITYKCDRCLKELDKEEVKELELDFPTLSGLDLSEGHKIYMHFCDNCMSYTYKYIRGLLAKRRINKLW